MRPSQLVSVLGTLVVIVSAAPVLARCEPDTEPDRSDIAAARAAVAANCDCAAMATHGAYVRCASDQIDAVLVNRSCRREVRRCISRSTCGRPDAVTCCREKAGRTKCKIARSAAACEAKGGTAGSCASCCDACPAPGSGESCPAITTSTVTSTTTTVTTAESGYCCLRTETCGPFNSCQKMTSAECAAANGFPGVVGQSCSSPTPCVHAVTTMPPFACCLADQCVIAGFCECEQIMGGIFRPSQGCYPTNPCMTTSTVTTPSTTLETSTVTSTTTTVTTGGADYCCLRTETCGPFNTCQEMTPAECAAAHGFPGLAGQSCSSPAPCSHATTTTPPSACCVADQCLFTGFCECTAMGGTFRIFTSCSPGVCTTTTLPMSLIAESTGTL